jgi:integrase
MPVLRLTEKAVAALPTPEPYKEQVIYWDDKLPGFALVVGRRARTYIVKRSVSGRKVRVTIGRHGAVRKDGHVWTAQLARQRALELTGEIVAGLHGPEPAQPTAASMTLRQGMDLHLSAMARKRRSMRSIEGMRAEMVRHFSAWLELPLVEISAPDIELRLAEIRAACKPRALSVNEPGAALTARLVRYLSACWHAVDRLHELPGRNPATRIVSYEIRPNGTRIAGEDLPAWYAAVMAMAPVRRDFYLLAGFTGLRADSIRHVAWPEVDFARGLVQIERAKGNRPFTLPMTATVREILARRLAENPAIYDPYGGDHGLAFPSLTRRKPYRVIPLAEPKERRKNKETKQIKNVVPGPHTMRRTFNSVAMEAGVPREAREMLLNHAGEGVNVRAYGLPERWDYLAECAAKVEAALWARIRASSESREPTG